MTRYAAFLRGMNVGGHRITNAELCAAFSAMGLLDVHSFRASGNVVFMADERSPGQITARIEEGLALALGYAVPTFLRTDAEVRAIAAMQPFEADLLEASAGKLQVAMLAARPGAPARRQVLALAGDEDRLAFGTRELYWLPSGGILESALDLKSIDALLGASTRRTMNTVEQMAGKYFAG
jgi:uncharacterized protein (DUF1697 family)